MFVFINEPLRRQEISFSCHFFRSGNLEFIILKNFIFLHVQKLKALSEENNISFQMSRDVSYIRP